MKESKTVKRERQPVQITPPLVVEFAWLDKPRPPFEAKAGAEPKFCLTASGNSDDEGIQALVKLIEGDGRPRGVPYSIDKESGDYHFKFSSKYPIEIFDSQGNKTEGVFPGKGSVVRVAFVRNEYPGFGGGVNLYLNGVQVIELVAFTPRGGVAFPPFDGGYVREGGGTVEQEPEKDDAAKEAEARSERTLPF